MCAVTKDLTTFHEHVTSVSAKKKEKKMLVLNVLTKYIFPVEIFSIFKG